MDIKIHFDFELRHLSSFFLIKAMATLGPHRVKTERKSFCLSSEIFSLETFKVIYILNHWFIIKPITGFISSVDTICRTVKNSSGVFASCKSFAISKWNVFLLLVFQLHYSC